MTHIPYRSRHFTAEVLDNREGSGNSNDMMEWSDDEDLGAEGSGGQTEGSGDTIHDDDQEAIAPVFTAEDVRHTKFIHRLTTTATYKEPSLETRPPTRPPVIAKPPEVGSTDRPTLSVLTAFIIILWAPLLLH
ncbi:unnamed protein product [Litomosoides sigmodontis]|uniref:Uncharacterized protein n=1 Tax=Litomosoides sigmodontis TaxID=42156 RepID=A0A3P6TFJ5_LITSI|nr:unnamed protein product [Litomosoides sigmodontis]